MPDAVTIMISLPSVEAVSTALDMAAAAATIEMGAHLYFSGAAVIWFSPRGEAVEAVGAATDEEREAVMARCGASRSSATSRSTRALGR